MNYLTQTVSKNPLLIKFYIKLNIFIFRNSIKFNFNPQLKNGKFGTRTMLVKKQFMIRSYKFA